MADPVVHITNGVPDSGTGNITTLGQTLVDGANATMGVTTGAAVVTDATGTLQQYLRGMVKLFAAAVAGVTGALFTKLADGSGNLLTSTGNALDINVKSGVNANGAAVAASSAPTTLATDQATLAVAFDTSQILNGKAGVSLTPTKVKISVATATTTTLVALVAGKKIRILSMYLVCAAADTITFQSHTTTANSDGGCSYAANGGISLPFNPIGWFDTTAGEALDMVTSASGQVSGQLTYVAV